MDFKFLLSGVMIGLLMGAPLGPAGVVCIRRSLADGRLKGLFSGLGIATADAFYGFIAAFGVTFVSSFLIDQEMWFRLIGGIFLLFLGVRTCISEPQAESSEPKENDYLHAYISMFLLTLTNPMTLISFVALFAAFGVASSNHLSAMEVVFGVFMGSAFWWLVLMVGISIFKIQFNPNTQKWLNRIAGVIIVTFGIFAILSFVFAWK